MSTFERQLIINRFHLPKEICDIIKDFLFHSIKKIPKHDPRFERIRNIPLKAHDSTDGVTFVYMTINHVKDYFMTYYNSAIQLQTIVYHPDNTIQTIEGYEIEIE